MRVGYFQFEVRSKNPRHNVNHVMNTLNGKHFDLMVLPELFTSGYLFRSKAELVHYAESVPDGPTINDLERFCHRNNCHIIAGLPERDGECLYNTAAIIGPCGYTGKHRKIVLSQYEKSLFDRGDTCDVFDIGGVRIGIVICLESWLPETSRRLMQQGCQILCNPASFGGTMTLNAIRTRAIENMFFTVTANRLGEELEGGIHAHYRGDSRIHDINGNVLIYSRDRESLAIIDIDPVQASQRRNEIWDLDQELAAIQALLTSWR